MTEINGFLYLSLSLGQGSGKVYQMQNLQEPHDTSNYDCGMSA